MEYSHKIEAEVLCLKLTGDLIGGSFAEELLALVDQSIQEGNGNCSIDIEEVRYINSSGIGALITVLTKLRNRGGDLVLINPSEHVQKLLIMTKLENIFNIAASENEAFQLLNN